MYVRLGKAWIVPKKRFEMCKLMYMVFAVCAIQGSGLMPDQATRFRCNGKELYHFMGCSTFSKYTVCPEISVAEVSLFAFKTMLH